MRCSGIGNYGDRRGETESSDEEIHVLIIESARAPPIYLDRERDTGPRMRISKLPGGGHPLTRTEKRAAYHSGSGVPSRRTHASHSGSRDSRTHNCATMARRGRERWETLSSRRLAAPSDVTGRWAGPSTPVFLRRFLFFLFPFPYPPSWGCSCGYSLATFSVRGSSDQSAVLRPHLDSVYTRYQVPYPPSG